MGKKKTKMGKCMSEWKSHHPKGRGKVDDPHKQAVVVCLSKTGQSNEGLSFKDFLDQLDEQTYSPDAPHHGAYKDAASVAQRDYTNTLIAVRVNPKTGEEEYAFVPPGESLPDGFEIWAEVTPRGKIRRVGGMYR